MTPLRRKNILETLRQMIWRSRPARSFIDGPGCTSDSCVQAWDRNQPRPLKPARESRRLRPGLY